MAANAPHERTPERHARSSWSFPIGNVGGIEIRVHVTFFLLVALFVLGSTAPGGGGVFSGLAWLTLIFACIVVHELAHCVVGRARGAKVHEIVLLPIGGVSKFEQLPETPSDELALAIAGPLASVGLAVAGALVAIGLGLPLLPVDFATGPLVVRLVWFNLIIAGFNLLPAFPLDGGRVFRALLERRYDMERSTHLAASVGRGLAIVLVGFGVFVNLWFAIIGAFVYFGASLEEAATIQHLRLRGLRVRDLMVSGPYEVVDAALPVLSPGQGVEEEALPLVVATPGHALAVVDRGRVVGRLRLEDVQHLVADPARRAGRPGPGSDN
jgi:Zn-dependent protease